VQGEAKVRAYATPQSTLAALAALEKAGKKTRVAFVHDRETGLKLFAGKAWYVQDPKDVSVAAFLLRERAESWARAHDGRVAAPGKVAPTTTATLP
jgi:NitT/TauT family transport system substrate-binding protein